jgi:hypothetical protein
VIERFFTLVLAGRMSQRVEKPKSLLSDGLQINWLSEMPALLRSMASFRKLIGRGPTAWPAGYQSNPPRRLDRDLSSHQQEPEGRRGYNFTNFSDELTDLKYNHRGIFVNLIGTK